MAADRSCLVVVLGRIPSLGMMADCPERSITLLDTTYTDQTGEDLIGFYDWLRDSSGTVIGVRETFASGFEWISGSIPDEEYLIKTDEPPRVEIFFSGLREFDPSESADQDFLMNRVLASEDGQIALTFGIDPEVGEQLMDSDAAWIPVLSVDCE